MDEHPVPSVLDIDNPVATSVIHSHSSEHEPLLPASNPKYKPAKWQPHSPLAIVSLLYAIVFLLQFGAKLMYVPSIRIFEWILCHNYFNRLEGDQHIGIDDDLPESMCKIEAVQTQLNILVSVVWMLNCIPGWL